MSVYYEDINITKENGLYKLAKQKKEYPPEKEILNEYYLIAANQGAVAIHDIIFTVRKNEYNELMESNINGELATKIINKYIPRGLEYVIHKPQKELDEMLNDDNQNTEEKENNYTK